MNIKEQIKMVPKSSGCYQYFDKNGEIIYIGKAKNLHKRVSSYFNRVHSSAKLNVMVPQIVRLECIITDTEIEALILESQLIKKYKPKYNVLLKDDKKFPYFLITEEEYPRIVVTRKRNKNPLKGKYYGPYTDARAMWATLDLLQKLFPLKKCKNPKFKDRPCLYYHIGRCLAPCQKLATQEEYANVLKKAELFLSGRQNELIRELKKEMERYSEKQEYEKAARFRDSYLDVVKTMERQKVVSENTRINQDYVAIAQSNEVKCATVIQIREGRLIGKRDFAFKNAESEQEVVKSLMGEYYAICTPSDIAKEILLPLELEDEKLYADWLSYQAGRTVKIKKVKSKKELELMELAGKNANFNLEKVRLEGLSKIYEDYNQVGAYLQEKFKLSKFPQIIECYDISHIQGTNTVASQVTFEYGMPKKSLYRRYKIRSTEGKPDDFASMQEVLRRRFKRIKEKGDYTPDLIIVDGGKGQLSSAFKAREEAGIEVEIVSLAKRLEEVFIEGRKTPVMLPSESAAFYLIQRIRDEAHRFAVEYHRKLRSKGMVE